MKVLYVEDEKKLSEAVIYLLSRNKINADLAEDGEKAVEAIIKSEYDVIILDIILPKLSGIDVLKNIRARGIKTPVIMLSALNEVEDKIRGLDEGADDYLAKPFKMAELLARLNALSRRPPLADIQKITFADLELNTTERTINEIPLTNKEARILELLMKNPERTFPKSRLLTYAWDGESNQEENYVEVYISYLRKKINQISLKVKIKTIRNLGYKLTDVSQITQ